MHLTITSSWFGVRIQFLSNRYDSALSSCGIQRLICLLSHVCSAPAPAPLLQWIPTCVFGLTFKHISTDTFSTEMLCRWNQHHVILVKKNLVLVLFRTNTTWLWGIWVADISLQVCHISKHRFHFKPFQFTIKEKLTLLSSWATVKSAMTYFQQLQWEVSLASLSNFWSLLVKIMECL